MVIEMKERILKPSRGRTGHAGGTETGSMTGLLLNGPFTVILAHYGEVIGLTDRIRLRPLSVGEKGTIMFLSSEGSAVCLVCPNVDRVWIPMGGQPVIGSLERPLG
jgi:glutamate synthase domain-containing protein 1